MSEQLLNYIEDYDPDFWTEALLDIPAPSSYPLMEKFVNETHTAALMTAAVTSVVNSFKQPRAEHSLEFKQFLPRPSGMMLGLEILVKEAHLSVQTRTAVLNFFHHLEPCIQEIERYFAEASELGAERAMALHRFSLANAWRLLCLSAGDAVRALATETEERLPDLYNLSAGILQRLLDAAAHGQSPCLNAEGKPYLPPLPQRRQGSRRLLHEPATLSTANHSGHVFVRDVSQGGMGLDHVRRIKDGDAVTVTLRSGRTFNGTVMWRKGARAGIKFIETLPPSDPLLWG